MIAVLVGGVIIVLLSVLLGIALGKLDRERAQHETSQAWQLSFADYADRLDDELACVRIERDEAIIERDAAHLVMERLLLPALDGAA